MKNLRFRTLMWVSYFLLAMPKCSCDSEAFTRQTPGFLITSPDQFDFGQIPIGFNVRRTLTILNTGQRDLTIESILVESATEPFSADRTSFVLQPEKETTVIVHFRPDEERIFESYLIVTHDGANEAPDRIRMLGEGVSDTICTSCGGLGEECLDGNTQIRYEYISGCEETNCLYQARQVDCECGCDVEVGQCLICDGADAGQVIDPPVTMDAGPSLIETTLRVDAPEHWGDFLLQAAMPVDEDWNGTTYVNHVQAQTEIISRRASGAPRVVQVIARVSAQTNEANITQTGQTITPTLYNLDLSELKLLMNVANVDETLQAPLITDQSQIMRDGVWLKEKRYWSRFTSPADPSLKLMGMHTYITQRSDIEIYEITIHVSNATCSATGEGVNGEVYFKSIQMDLGNLFSDWVVLSDLERPSMNLNATPPEIVSPLGADQYHFMPARAGFVRRLVLARPDQIEAAKEILLKKGYGRAEGENSYYQKAAYGENLARLPEITEQFSWNNVIGLEGAKARVQLHSDALKSTIATGGNNAYEAMISYDARGWFHAHGYSNGQTVGGNWIHPSSGELNFREEWVLYDRWLRTGRDRSPVAIFDPETGEIVSTQMLAAANTTDPGKQPFEVSHAYGQMRKQVRWLVHPDAQGSGSQMLLPTNLPWNSLPSGGSSPYDDQLRYYDLYGAENVFGYWDAQHAVRGLSCSRVSIWALNDSYAKDNLKMWGNHWQQSWTHFPLGSMTDTNRKYVTSLYHLREKIIEDGTTGYGGELGRGKAWMSVIMAARYAIETPTWRSENKSWYELAAEIFDRSAMPTGVTNRNNSEAWSGSPNPYSYYGTPDTDNSSGSLLTNYDVAPANEQTFMTHAANAILNNVFEGDTNIVYDNSTAAELLANIVIQSARAMHQTYPEGTIGDGPPKFLVVAENGEAPFTNLLPWDFDGNKELIYSPYHLVNAYRLTEDPWFKARLVQVIGGGTYSDWIATQMAYVSQQPIYTFNLHNVASAIAEMQYWASQEP